MVDIESGHRRTEAIKLVGPVAGNQNRAVFIPSLIAAAQANRSVQADGELYCVMLVRGRV